MARDLVGINDARAQFFKQCGNGTLAAAYTAGEPDEQMGRLD
jgi:hypothetical protein